MWVAVLATVVAVVFALRLFYRRTSGRCHSQRKLVGKTVIITGASAGIGKYTAMDLVRRGARVILACRNLQKACKVAAEISKAAGSGAGDLIVRQLDTSDLASVRKFAEEILQTEKALHILINNAGIYGSEKRQMTREGLEVTMATNHYGHFLLTNLLLELLKKSCPSRVINVSSAGHFMASTLNPDALNFEDDSYTSMRAYCRSKLCNILFTRELADRLKGTGVTANSLHPGVVHTELLSSHPNSIMTWLLKLTNSIICKDEELGAQTTIHLAVSDEVEGITGRYFVDCKEAKPSSLAQQKRLAQLLWKASEVDVERKPSEIPY
nr:retinol dehydrogenase 14-like [Procambarus clarkii]